MRSNQIGTKKKIVCPDCDGAGTTEDATTCQECGGTGTVEGTIVKQ